MKLNMLFSVIPIFTLIYVGYRGPCNEEQIENIGYGCHELNVLLEDKSVRNILRLDSADELNPSIRIIDLTGSLDCTGGFTKGKATDVLVPFIVTPRIELNLNTGKYRDLAVLKRGIENIDGSITYTLSGATFGRRQGQASLYRVEITLLKDSTGNYHIHESTISEID